MYLHLIDDTSQINHLIRRSNEMFPGKHLFYVLTQKDKVHNVEVFDNVVPLRLTSKNVFSLNNKFPGFKAIFIHNLCALKAKIILLSEPEVKFIWGIWGFDYYNVYPELYKRIFLPKTIIANILLCKLSLSFKFLLYSADPLLKYIGIKSPDRIKMQAAKRIKYTLNNMPHHSEVFNILNIPVENRFNGIYYSIEAITQNLFDKDFKLGENILIGNSASNSSNHIDLFYQIKSFPLKGKKVIVSLGYGCNRYRKLVNFIGRRTFGKSYYPLNKFLPLDKYNEYLLSCSVMIFNHKRAQAIGNILLGIWAGHKIFLRKDNPVYKYLLDLGVFVYSVEDDLTYNNLCGLDYEKRKTNRKIINSHYSEKSIRRNYNQIVKAIDNLPNE